MIEFWKDIPGWERYYAISSLGHVKSLARTIIRKNGVAMKVCERILKPGIQTSGHLMVVLYRPGIKQTARVASLVLQAFIGNTPAGKEVCHVNGKHTDNCLDNLMYGTRSLNTNQKVAHGQHPIARKVRRCDGKIYHSASIAAQSIGLC